MLKDLTRADWLGILELPEARIPAVLLVRGTRNFRAKYRATLPYFDNVHHVGTPNGIIEDVLIGEVPRCRRQAMPQFAGAGHHRASLEGPTGTIPR